jgi:hypothetical protein
MALPDDIKVFPAFLQGMVDRVNALLKAVRPLDALEVTAPLTLSKTDKVARLGVSRPALQDALRGALIEAVTPPHPFQVTLTNPSTPSATISANSYVWSGYTTAGTTETITDLTTAITLAANTRVYLRLTVSSLAVTARAIVTATSAVANVVTSGSPAAQTQANWLIGRVGSGALPAGARGFNFAIGTDAYHFEQTLFDHLTTINACVNGTPSIILTPLPGS